MDAARKVYSKKSLTQSLTAFTAERFKSRSASPMHFKTPCAHRYFPARFHGLRSCSLPIHRRAAPLLNRPEAAKEKHAKDAKKGKDKPTAKTRRCKLPSPDRALASAPRRRSGELAGERSAVGKRLGEGAGGCPVPATRSGELAGVSAGGGFTAAHRVKAFCRNQSHVILKRLKS